MHRLPSLFMVVLLAVGSTLGLVSPATAAPVPAPATAAPSPAPAPVSSVARPYVDQGLVLSGTVGTVGVRQVTLQHRTSAWKSDQTVSTKADGSYSLTAKTSKAEREFRVLAPATASVPEVRSAAVTIRTQTDKVLLVVSRDRRQGRAIGTARVENPGRAWSLQVKAGGWTQVGAKVAEGADGAIQAFFPLRSAS